jgi:hypothetical protein
VASFCVILGSIIGELWIIFGFPTLWNPNPNPEMPIIVFQILQYILIGVVGFILVVGIIAGIQYWKDYFPEYTVTADSIILDKWNWRGKQSTQTLELGKIKTLYIGEEPFESNSFWFYTKSVKEIMKECPEEIRKEFDFEFPYDCFLGWDLEFSHVDRPIRLLKVFESLIPLKQHPAFPTLFQRIE